MERKIVPPWKREKQSKPRKRQHLGGPIDLAEPEEGLSLKERVSGFFGRLKPPAFLDKLRGERIDLSLPGKEAVEQKAYELGSKAREAFVPVGSFVAENSRTAGEFVLRNASMTSLRWGAREAAKGVWSVSGVAGAIGGGIAGTAVGGAVVGAVAGAAVEYVRQVNQNLDNLPITRRSTGRTMSIGEAFRIEDLALENRSAILLYKVKGLRHVESWKPNDISKLGKAALFGAAAGAGAGALADAFNHREEIVSFLAEKGVTADKIVGALGSVAKTAGDIAGGTVKFGEENVGAMAGAVGRFAADVGQRISPTGAGEAVKEIGNTSGETAEKIPDGYMKRDIFDKLTREQTKLSIDQQNQIVGLQDQNHYLRDQVEDLQDQNHSLSRKVESLKRQLAETQQAQVLPMTGSATPSHEALTSGAEAARGAVDDAAQKQIDEAFAKLGYGEAYKLQPGDSIERLSQNIGRSLGWNTGDLQRFYALSQQIARSNDVASSYIHTSGKLVDTNLPVGQIMDLRGTKTLALGIMNNRGK